MHNETPTLTRDDVVSLCGPLDDLKIAEIIGTGATRAELAEALQWVEADDTIGEMPEKTRAGRVGELYEILTTEDEEWDEP